MSDRRQAARRAEDVFKKLAWVALIVAVVISVAGCIALAVALGHADSINTQAAQANRRAARATEHATTAVRRANRALATLHQQVLQGCVRLNLQRVEVNVSNLADYYVDRTVLIFSLAARHVTPDTARFEKAFLPRLRFAVEAKRWTPLTDCGRVVRQNSVYYRAPTPIRFSRRLPPPLALDLANASRISPHSSVP